MPWTVSSQQNYSLDLNTPENKKIISNVLLENNYLKKDVQIKDSLITKLDNKITLQDSIISIKNRNILLLNRISEEKSNEISFLRDDLKNQRKQIVKQKIVNYVTLGAVTISLGGLIYSLIK